MQTAGLHRSGYITLAGHPAVCQQPAAQPDTEPLFACTSPFLHPQLLLYTAQHSLSGGGRDDSSNPYNRAQQASPYYDQRGGYRGDPRYGDPRLQQQQDPRLYRQMDPRMRQDPR